MTDLLPDQLLSLTDTLGTAPTRFSRGRFNLLDEAREGVPAHGFQPDTTQGMKKP